MANSCGYPTKHSSAADGPQAHYRPVDFNTLRVAMSSFISCGLLDSGSFLEDSRQTKSQQQNDSQHRHDPNYSLPTRAAHKARTPIAAAGRQHTRSYKTCTHACIHAHTTIDTAAVVADTVTVDTIVATSIITIFANAVPTCVRHLSFLSTHIHIIPRCEVLHLATR